MERIKELPKIHFAWIVLLGCCLMSGATVGVVVNCRGMFFQPVCTELGFDLSEFTAQQIFFGIGAAASTPLVYPAFKKGNLRILLLLMLLLYAGTCGAMGISRRLTTWFALAAVQGLASSFVSLMPLPILINQWFANRKGTAVSISGTACGVFGVLFNMLGARVIETYGWRTGYFFSAAVCLVIGLPAVLWMIRWDPAEQGLAPYKSKKRDPKSHTAAEKISAAAIPAGSYKTRLFLFSIIALAATLSTGIVQHINKFAVSVGFDNIEAAKFAACLMAGNIIGKLLLGKLSDCRGMALSVSVGIGTVAFGAILGGTIHQAAAIPLAISAFCLGFTQGLYTVGLPIIVYASFRKETVAKVITCQTFIFNLASCIAVSLFSLLYESSGGYGLPLAVIVCYAVIESVALFLLSRCTSRKSSEKRSDLYLTKEG